jgi:hypothetical protein
MDGEIVAAPFQGILGLPKGCLLLGQPTCAELGEFFMRRFVVEARGQIRQEVDPCTKMVQTRLGVDVEAGEAVPGFYAVGCGIVAREAFVEDSGSVKGAVVSPFGSLRSRLEPAAPLTVFEKLVTMHGLGLGGKENWSKEEKKTGGHGETELHAAPLTRGV